MWFLAWFFSGVIFGFFLACLCKVAAKPEERSIERGSDLEKKIENAA
jgi:hypothetical protein